MRAIFLRATAISLPMGASLEAPFGEGSIVFAVTVSAILAMPILMGATLLTDDSKVRCVSATLDPRLHPGTSRMRPSNSRTCLKTAGRRITASISRSKDDRVRAVDAGPVSLDRLRQVAELAEDLEDPDVMSGAWS